MSDQGAPGFDADAVREHVRLNPDDSAVTILGALGIDPGHLDDVRALVDDGPEKEFCDRSTRPRDGAPKVSDRDADTAEPVTEPTRNAPADGVRHTPDSISNESNTPDGTDPADDGGGVGGGGFGDRDTKGESDTHPPDEPTDCGELDPGPEGETPRVETSKTGVSNGGEWRDADFATTTPGRFPRPHHSREQWMGRKAKLPFAPWGDRNADLDCTHTHCPDHDDDTAEDVVDSCPDCRAHQDGTTTAECDHDARYKWGHRGHYVDGDTVAIAEDDPRLDGRVFIQRDTDPFAFVDGDDVRCPETGDVHPAFVDVLDALGLTYADVSTSGAGVHAYYTGDLPNDMGQAVFEIDTEPWGANDDPPTVEIYANKHVCVATGDHVAGTPDDAAEWGDDGLRAVLDEYGALDDPSETVDHDTDRDLDLGDYEPTATTADETTGDVRDIVQAVDRLRPSDLPLRTRQVGTDGTGWERWNPSSYRTSSGNDSLHRPAGEPVFHDHKHGESFGVLSLFAAEQGIISKPWDRLAGNDWWDAVDAARDGGAPVPEYDTSENVDRVAVLPPAVRDLATAASGWDWRHAGRRETTETDPLDDARDRTTDVLADAMQRSDHVLVEALPTLGKSYGTIQAAAETGEPVTVLTTRGNKEQYAQIEEWAADRGLSTYRLPSFTRDCPTASGEHGEEWKRTVRGWYDRGATPREIHENAEYELGRPLPCQENGECEHELKWHFDPDGYDVLIGHYTHAHVTDVSKGRTVVFDEFPEGAYETKLGHGLAGSVSYFLKCHDALPFDDYTDLVENRHDDALRAAALDWFEGRDVDRDGALVFGSDAGHAAAPLAALTILKGATEHLGNGWERARLDDAGKIGLFDREQGRIWLLSPPELQYTRAVLALDGTPTKALWELALGSRLNHRPVLTDDERREYIRDGLNLNIVRTTDAVKPYSNPDYVNADQDAALLEAIADHHGQRPALITSRAAEEDVYPDVGVLDLVDGTEHYGNVLGSNEFADRRLGAVIGSRHYGDGYVKKWAAYAGDVADRNDEKGVGLSYGAFGDDVLTHMREHETLQAAMRFGRDGNGAVVYVHTNTLPEWVPLAGEGRVVTTWGDGMKQVVRAARDLGTWRTADLADHPDVGIGTRQVFNVLDDLAARGFVDREHDGRGYTWRDDGLHRVSEHGDVELDPVDLDDVDDETVQEIARTTLYTWEFRDSGENTDAPDTSATRSAGGDAPTAADGATGPPDPAD